MRSPKVAEMSEQAPKVAEMSEQAVDNNPDDLSPFLEDHLGREPEPVLPEEPPINPFANAVAVSVIFPDGPGTTRNILQMSETIDSGQLSIAAALLVTANERQQFAIFQETAQRAQQEASRKKIEVPGARGFRFGRRRH